MAAVVVGLSLSVTSCKDDDDDDTEVAGETAEPIDGDPYAKTSQPATDLLMVMSQLADVDSLPDNWRDATFEPTEGEVLDASMPFVRTVAVMDMTEAHDLFRSFTGENFDESKSTVTWKNDAVGTMTFKAVNQHDCVATIDMQLKQMPHLTQLRLVPTSALGDNKLKYDPYYHIGDVVRDRDGRYWICVRAAGGPKNKEKTHWVTMQLLTADSKVTGLKSNVKEFAPTSKHEGYKVPQNLGGDETEHLKYFAQLMYLLRNPEEYSNNLGQGNAMANGLGALGYDTEADHTAYNQQMVNKMASDWDKLDLWSKVLPPGVTKDFFNNGEINMFYYGHSNDLIGSGITLYVCNQSGPCLSTQSLRKLSWTKNKAGQAFDITEFANYGRPMVTNVVTTKDKNVLDDALVVCMATGKELAGTLLQPDYTDRFEKVSEIYNLERYIESEFEPHYLPGDVYKDEKGHRWFVLYSSGYNQHNSTVINSSCAYLVSFEGLEFSQDNKTVTNLPNFELALRASIGLYQIISVLGANFDPKDVETFANDPNPTGNRAIMYNIYKHAQVNLAAALPKLKPAQGGRSYFINFCVGYQTGTPDLQLLRIVLNGYDMDKTYVQAWQHYPQEPFTAFKMEGPAAFSNDPIRLADIADEDMVGLRAYDYFATVPLRASGVWRQERSQTDASANDARNYQYNLTQFENGTYHTSMWNEPVLLFRVTKVYDKGEDDYSTKTLDGHTLKLVNAMQRTEKRGTEVESLVQELTECIMADCEFTYKLITIDGKPYTMPLPDEDWK